MKRGQRWQERVDQVYAEAMDLGVAMQRAAARGLDFSAERERFWTLLAEYNRLHGAGESGQGSDSDDR